jgi:hypothetical protein
VGIETGNHTVVAADLRIPLPGGGIVSKDHDVGQLLLELRAELA